jgi:hypothetical protein
MSGCGAAAPAAARGTGRVAALGSKGQFPHGCLAVTAGTYDGSARVGVERTVNRRDFCSSVVAATGVATAGLATAAGASWAPALGPATGVRPRQLIFDQRFVAARLFGAEAARRGIATTAFNGDVTALWFHDLGPRWAVDRAPIAGITTPEALFCLEQLARDAWMRVTVRAEHAGTDARSCGHRVTGRAAAVDRVCAALDAGADWPARMALALAIVSPDVGAGALQRRIDAGGGPPGAERRAKLVSWMIAT